MGQYFLNGMPRSFEKGDRLIKAAEEIKGEYDNDILLFKDKHRYLWLGEEITEGMRLRAVTAREPEGHACYQKSVTFMLMKAVYDVGGADKIDKVRVMYNIDSALYINIIGDVDTNEDFAAAVQRKMEEYVRADIPIKKRIMSTEDAIALFNDYNMKYKSDLLKYRKATNVNIYSIGGFDDYYFINPAYSTGMLRYFEVLCYDGGLVLNLPSPEDPKTIKKFSPPSKTFAALKRAAADFAGMGVESVAELNDKIVKGEINQTIVMQETLMERRIAEIADDIKAHSSCRFVLIAGPSSSGKTTFSKRLCTQLMTLGLRPHQLSTDDYFFGINKIPKDENGEPDREGIGAVDLRLFTENMNALLRGEKIELPYYNFKKGVREYRGRFAKLAENDVFVIEGIHGLNEKLSEGLPKESKYKIYISPVISLNIDERNRVPTSDLRLIRRIIRDARTRGTDAATTISWWENVRKGELKNILPYRESADVVFNSSLVYELAAIKLWAEPLLYGVDRESEEYSTAKRLLKFFDFILSIDNDDIPNTSLIREFIGGSCFED